MFERLTPLIGKEGLNKINSSTVLVLGCGGVGSYAIEALVRSGLGSIIIVDGDVFNQTDLNRQLPALHSTLGLYKVTVLEKRIKDINPDCKVIPYPLYYDNTSKSMIFEHPIDFVIDAIDTMKWKLDIILTCKEKNIRFVSVCGQGNRMQPEMITLKELSLTRYDPIARILRYELRKLGKLENTMCVFSEEIPIKQQNISVIASTAFGPGTAGLIAASYAIKQLLEETHA